MLMEGRNKEKEGEIRGDNRVMKDIKTRETMQEEWKTKIKKDGQRGWKEGIKKGRGKEERRKRR